MHPSPGQPEPELTYGEYVRLRASALRAISLAQKTLTRVTDPRYTPFAENGVEIARNALEAAQVRLGYLIARWELQQMKVRVVR